MTKSQWMSIIENSRIIWPKEDKEQIDWVLDNFHHIQHSIIGKAVKQKIELTVQQGPFGEIASSQNFMDAIRFIRKVIESQISKESDENNLGNVINRMHE